VDRALQKIVWIVSYPKSGNTWFRVLLSNLNGNLESPASINQLQTTPIASSRSMFDEVCGTASSDLSAEEIDLLRPEVYTQLAKRSPGIVYKKVHDVWSLNSAGKPLFPPEVTRAVIYIIRNPLDIAVSYAYHTGKGFGEIISQMGNDDHSMCARPSKLYNQLRQKLSGWSGHVRSWVDDSGLPLFLLKYEDMLADPGQCFGDALNFIGLEFQPEKLSRAIEFSSFKNLNSLEKKEGFREKPIQMKQFFRSGRSGEGGEKLTEKERGTLIGDHREMMIRFGYLDE